MRRILRGFGRPWRMGVVRVVWFWVALMVLSGRGTDRVWQSRVCRLRSCKGASQRCTSHLHAMIAWPSSFIFPIEINICSFLAAPRSDLCHELRALEQQERPPHRTGYRKTQFLARISYNRHREAIWSEVHEWLFSSWPYWHKECHTCCCCDGIPSHVLLRRFPRLFRLFSQANKKVGIL